MKTAGKKIVEYIMDPNGRPGAFEVEQMIETAIADARAAGYAEAIEKAATIANRIAEENPEDEPDDSEDKRIHGPEWNRVALAIEYEIRALAPAATTEGQR